MSSSLFKIICPRRSRSIFSSIPMSGTGFFLLSSPPKKKILFRPPKPSNEQLVMDILRDFAEKHRGLPSFSDELWKLLESTRLKELGVGDNPIPIPDKQDWKASWHEKGKPNWLGTKPTVADNSFHCTSDITGYLEEGTNGGGYGVIIFDTYGRPKVASVGVSPQRHVPLVYYELQGVRSALQLASEYGFPGITLYCNSNSVRRVLRLCFEFMSFRALCTETRGRVDHVCACCVGLDVYRLIDDFDLLGPIIKEIVELLSKVKSHGNIRVTNCSASDHLVKCYRMPRTDEEMNLFRRMAGDLELYEMVMKPDKFPEEVEDDMYDEVFKGDKRHGRCIILDISLRPRELYHKIRPWKTKTTSAGLIC